MVTVNISNKTAYVLIGILALVIATGSAIALYSNDWQVHGHDASEIEGDGYKIVYGVIDEGGTKVSGEGFTSLRLGTGKYEVTFTEAFSANPAVTITPEKAGSSPVLTMDLLSTTGFQFYDKNTHSGNNQNDANSFIAVGR